MVVSELSQPFWFVRELIFRASAQDVHEHENMRTCEHANIRKFAAAAEGHLFPPHSGPDREGCPSQARTLTDGSRGASDRAGMSPSARRAYGCTAGREGKPDVVW